ncbi:MAG: phenylalanine--tRNA ligase subunit alpha [Desulfuromonadaceae bacterium]|nr:phenylalanine--tRNA ligase subunit alpha [Desulfuromonadaceae bacterium]
MKQQLDEILAQGRELIAEADSEFALNELKVQFLGKKGKVTALMKGMADLSAEERPAMGKVVNEVKSSLEELFEARFQEVRELDLEKRLSSERIDVTLPGRRLPKGSLHPITLVTDEVVGIFSTLGFGVVEGPEIENDYYNFEALNMPRNHPARDMQDTFYISEDVVLRTHTSPVQIRTMLKQRPPVKVIAPGTVYRRDSDLTHSPMFHQVEGFLVDRQVTFGDLKGTLQTFLNRFFGHEIGVRFRPSFFPFTEPSAEVDIACVICGGKGCRVCKDSGWLEILGCGMIDPEVFKAVGYDPAVVTGYAFGMGLERLCMLKNGINDLRLFFENDIRFLRQF